MLCAIVGFGAVVACTRVTVDDGYTDSESAKAYFAAALPRNVGDDVSKVGVCEGRDGAWLISIQFDDGVQITYAGKEGSTVVELADHSTRSMRKAFGKHSVDTCFDGPYRFVFTPFGMRADVRTTLVVSHPFDKSVKDRLDQAAAAVVQAMQEHAAFKPTEESWGAEP